MSTVRQKLHIICARLHNHTCNVAFDLCVNYRQQSYLITDVKNVSSKQLDEKIGKTKNLVFWTQH